MLSTWRREDNYEEYLRLLQNDDYLDVTYDEKSGGVSAVHILHKFDKQRGPSGIPRGDYERKAIEVLRKNGHRVLLEAEPSSGDKKCDGLLDDVPMDIKSVEGQGVWSISTKLLVAEKQHARCVVLYFPDKTNYSHFRIKEGIRLYLSNPERGKDNPLIRVLTVVEESLMPE